MEYEVGDWFISFTSRFLALTAYFGVTNKYLLLSSDALEAVQ